MVYGMSLLYGMTGSLDLVEIRQGLAAGQVPQLALLVATAFVLAGFGFKIAMVPFHMWSPDVYEGASTPVTAFLSVAPKAAGLAVLLRFTLAGSRRRWTACPGRSRASTGRSCSPSFRRSP